MNSQNLPSLHSGVEADAMFNELEQDLLSLTTAMLDDEIVPTQLVDEFATEFLRELARPPR
jgi:hypothetical protein